MMKRLYTVDDVEEMERERFYSTDENDPNYDYNESDDKRADAESDEEAPQSFLKYISYAILFLALLAITYFLYEVKIVLDDPNVPNNVYLLNENLGGTNYKILEKVIASMSDKLSKRPVYIKAFDNKFVMVPSKDIDFKINPKQISEQVVKIGNDGNIFQKIKYKMRLKTGREKVVIPCKFFYNRTKLENFCAGISDYVNVSPKSSTVMEFDNGIKKITREISGSRISPEDIYKQVISALSDFSSQNLCFVNLQYEEVKPAVTVADKLKQLNSTDLLSEFETAFNDQNPSIKDNVEKAAKAVDGLILKPLEVFSFNKIVGPTKYKNEADARIFNSRDIGFFPDISGGIGVFSSALYNAVLGTTVEVLERYNHTNFNAQTAYCPAGRDSQIIYGAKDLKFMVPKNSAPLIIFADIKLNKIKISIYGFNKFSEKVTLESKELSNVKPIEKRLKDYSLKKNEEKVEAEGLNGCEVQTTKIVSVNGNENYRVVISNDMYSSVPKVIRVGEDPQE